jgi:hypothetical protein
MKRLLRSSRFWSTATGFIASNLSYKWHDDSTFALAILGAFTAIVVTTAVKDTAKHIKYEKNRDNQ